MRSIYLKNVRNDPRCQSCGGPKVIYPVGWTLSNSPVYGCKDKWHTRSIRQEDMGVN